MVDYGEGIVQIRRTMGRLRKQYEELSLAQRRVDDALREIQRTARWLSQQTGEDYSTFYQRLYVNADIPADTLRRISDVLIKSDPKYTVDWFTREEKKVSASEPKEDEVYRIFYALEGHVSPEQRDKIKAIVEEIVKRKASDIDAMISIVQAYLDGTRRL